MERKNWISKLEYSWNTTLSSLQSVPSSSLNELTFSNSVSRPDLHFTQPVFFSSSSIGTLHRHQYHSHSQTLFTESQGIPVVHNLSVGQQPLHHYSHSSNTSPLLQNQSPLSLPLLIPSVPVFHHLEQNNNNPNPSNHLPFIPGRRKHRSSSSEEPLSFSEHHSHFIQDQRNNNHSSLSLESQEYQESSLNYPTNSFAGLGNIQSSSNDNSNPTASDRMSRNHHQPSAKRARTSSR